MGTWTKENSRRDKSGKRWSFCYWYADLTTPPGGAARLFFWDDTKTDCGVVLFLPGSALRYSRISELTDKLVAHPAIREKHKRKLDFPLERHYSGYPVFSEENQIQILP